MKKIKTDSPIEIYNEFLKHEPEFKSMMGYGVEEIRKIGLHKFIKGMGWTSKDQVTSFKTDKAHIVPCVQCGEDFGVLEMSFGLCVNCEKKFDLRKFQNIMESASMVPDGGIQYNALFAKFYTDKNFREYYFTKGIDNGIPVIELKLEDEEGEVNNGNTADKGLEETNKANRGK